MSLTLNVLATVWRSKAELMLPTLLVPLALVALAISQPPRHMASAVLQVETERTQSPLLQNLEGKGNAEALTRLLRGNNLLRDTARDTGLYLAPADVKLEILNPHMLRIVGFAPRPDGLEATVDTLAANFIYDLMAPERLRTEQRLATVGKALDTAKTSLMQAIGTGTEQAETTRLQLEVQNLANQYSQLMDDMALINASFHAGNPGGLIRFAEPATLNPHTSPAGRVSMALQYGLAMGFGLGLLLAFWRRTHPRGFTHTTHLTHSTQLSLAGILPHMGAVHLVNGTAQVTVGHTTLNPVEFTETTRLHRTLTRNLHGALVITSTAGGEGTSMVAALLALKSAATGKRTLLVDLNLKNGLISHAFGQQAVNWELAPVKAAPRTGKTPARGFAMADVIARNVGANGLDVLPLPADKPTLEMLSTPAGAAALFDGLSSTYEHIVIDTTPLLAHNRQNADPILLAAAANRAALVVMMARTPTTLVVQAANQLVAGGANMVGVIANNMNNPSNRTVLMDMARALGRIAPAMAGWLRGKVIQSGME